MTTAVGSNSYIALIKQVAATPRVIPATPLLQKVNFTSEDMSTNFMTVVSNHIRSDRSTTDLIPTGLAVEGGYNFEFQFENSLLDDVIAGFLWSTWASGGSLGAGGKIIKNGSTYQPFFIEKAHTDIAQYFQYLGMACNQMTLEFPDQGVVTGNYSFIGQTSNLIQTPTVGATYTDPTANPVFTTSHNLPTISIDGVAQTSCIIKDFNVVVNNNVTPKTGVGVVGACETLAHRLSITGKLTMFFQDNTMYDHFSDGTDFAISWTLTDSNAKSYKFTLPKIKINENKLPIGGYDADVMENITYTALYDSTLGCMIQVEKTA